MKLFAQLRMASLLALFLAVALLGQSQDVARTEAPDLKAWRAITERRFRANDLPDRRVQLAEAFLRDSSPEFVHSLYREEVFRILFDAYKEEKNWAMALGAVDRLDNLAPGMTPQERMRVYAEAITIAADLKDSRQASYGEKKSAAELELEASKDVEERPAGVITGQLRLQDGTPVVGVPVTTIPVISNKEVPNAFQTARTDKAGRYRFNVPFGSYRVTANHDEGFSAVSSRDQTTAVEVLSAVAVTADFYFAVITVRGRVILPENQLLNGVEVVISPDFGLSAPKTTAVSRDGFFEFRGLLPNSYHVRTNYPSTGSFIKVTDGDVTGLEFNLLPVTAKEVTLVETLTRMRTAIWRYRTERNEAPQTLDDLVTARLIPQVPVDPMTGYAITWQTEIGRSVGGDGIMDIHSGSIELSALSKSPYNTW